MWLQRCPPVLALPCSAVLRVRASATMPLAPLVGAKRVNLCFWWGEQRCAPRGAVAMSHPNRAVVWGCRQFPGCRCGVREWAAREDWLTSVWASLSAGWAPPPGPFFPRESGRRASCCCARGLSPGLAPPSHPQRRQQGRPSGQAGRGRPLPPIQAAAPPAPPSPHRPGLTILARVSSSEASPMPGDPHDVSLAGGGPAAFQPREDLWLEGLGQAEVPCEALRWTQTGSHHPQPGPAALQRSP